MDDERRERNSNTGEYIIQGEGIFDFIFESTAGARFSTFLLSIS